MPFTSVINLKLYSTSRSPLPKDVSGRRNPLRLDIYCLCTDARTQTHTDARAHTPRNADVRMLTNADTCKTLQLQSRVTYLKSDTI